MREKVVSIAVQLVAPVSFLFIWSFIAWHLGNQVILPTVDEVVSLLSRPTEDLISMGSLLVNVAVSLARVLTGYLLAGLIAIPVGVVMGYYGMTFKLFNNFLSLFRPIPPLAWVPLVMAWFGVSSLATLFDVEMGTWFTYLDNIKFSMIFIIFIGAFYPVLTATIQGVRNVNKTLVDSARVLGATEWQIFGSVLMPAAMPSIITGLRIGLGIAWMCLVSAEMLPGSLSGVGYLITHAYTVASTDIVIAGMVSIGVVGAVMDLSFRWFEERKFSWQRLSR